MNHKIDKIKLPRSRPSKFHWPDVAPICILLLDTDIISLLDLCGGIRSAPDDNDHKNQHQEK